MLCIHATLKAKFSFCPADMALVIRLKLLGEFVCDSTVIDPFMFVGHVQLYIETIGTLPIQTVAVPLSFLKI